MPVMNLFNFSMYECVWWCLPSGSKENPSFFKMIAISTQITDNGSM